MVKIGVLGAGTWGMALARMLSNMGYDVMVWSALPKEVEEYSRTRRHPNLPGMIIPDSIVFTKNIEEVCTGKDILLFAVPSVFVRSTARTAAPFVPDGQVIVDVAKGIEPDTLFTLTQVIGDELGKDGKHSSVRLVALSGPTHAEEVSLDLPTTIVASCTDMKTAEYVQKVFMNDVMRVYTNDDVLGIELCGALKNIIALASGIALGLGYGDNTKAALITRGMHEITMLGLKMGCKAGDLLRPGWNRRPDCHGDFRALQKQSLRASDRAGNDPRPGGEESGDGCRRHQCHSSSAGAGEKVRGRDAAR